MNGERRRSRIPRRISWVAASLSGLTLGSVVLVAAIPHPPGVPPLYAAGIAENPCAPHNVIVVPAGSRQHYYASSNVLETTSVTSCQQAAMTWLAMHATRLGTLPEKVDARGRPVSAAPLAWTDAAVLLALVAQAHPLPVVPVPAG